MEGFHISEINLSEVSTLSKAEELSDERKNYIQTLNSVWLYQELRKAEMSDVKVHIITHIPPGSANCLSK